MLSKKNKKKKREKNFFITILGIHFQLIFKLLNDCKKKIQHNEAFSMYTLNEIK